MWNKVWILLDRGKFSKQTGSFGAEFLPVSGLHLFLSAKTTHFLLISFSELCRPCYVYTLFVVRVYKIFPLTNLLAPWSVISTENHSCSNTLFLVKIYFNPNLLELKITVWRKLPKLHFVVCFATLYKESLGEYNFWKLTTPYINVFTLHLLYLIIYKYI